MDKDCIFCKIVNKEISSEIVFEDEDVIAFKDINPVAPIHILVIPKKHISTLMDLEENDARIIGKIFITIKEIARREGFGEKGYRVIANCGEDGGQEVKHIHFHVIAGKKLGTKIVK